MRFFLVIICLNLFQFLFSQSVGGTLNTNTTVCSGVNNGNLTLSGYTGSILRWEYAYTSTGPWTPVFFTSNTYNYINLVQSTYFKVIVQQTGYSEVSSNIVLVSCDAMTVPGTISATTLQCLNSSATMTLSASIGSVIAWESSSNNWISTNTLTALNSVTASTNPITTTTQIRVKIKNGVCPIINSPVLTILPAPLSNAGTISGTQSVCALSNSVTLSINNNTGAVQYWESSSNSGGPFNIISNTSNTLSILNLNQSSWYRAIVKNANCAAVSSSAFAVNVDQPGSGGFVTGPSAVCSSMNNGTLFLNGNIGNVTQWQVSTNGVSNWNTINSTSGIISFTNITSTSVYRAVVQNGLCPSVFSNQYTVQVNPLPIVNFNVSNGCEQSQISFTNTGNGSNFYSWDFNDGTFSNATHAVHTFSTSGTFTVKLIGVNMYSCKDSIMHTVSIYPKPLVNLLSADTICFGSSMLFFNNSTINSGFLNSIQFNFADGSPATYTSPVSHHFLSSGIFPVKLKVTSNFFCADSLIKTVQVFPKPNTNFLSQNVCLGSATNFTNLSSISNGFIQYQWNFGNSTTSNVFQPQFNYSVSGIYTVSLISNSDHNCTDTTFKQLIVYENPVLSLNVSNACEGSSVLFSGGAIASSVTPSYTLLFGDGATANTLSTSHVYSNHGNYLINLNSVTNSGCINSISKWISIYPKPKSAFTFSNVCVNDSIRFINNSTVASGSISYEWNFGNQLSSSLFAPSSKYQSPGNYTVQLISKSQFDCSDTALERIHIYPKPTSDFNFSNVCDKSSIHFTNTSLVTEGVIQSTFWNFGDNTFSFDKNPDKNFLNYGNYSVSLVTVSNLNCKDTVAKIVSVFEGPIANFTANNVCLGAATVFRNASQLKSGSFTSFWNFTDGYTSTEYATEHTYLKANDYMVSLKVVSDKNCIDSITKYVSVYQLPEVKVSSDTTIQKGYGITLKAAGANTYNWYPALGISNPTSQSPFVNPEISTSYVVIGTDDRGCVNYDTIHVEVKNEFLVTPFNILTPDNNGKNDTWIVKNIESYPNNSLLIFNQWNQKVFEARAYHNEWAGTNTRGEILPDATYYYILMLEDSKKVYTGYITLLRNQK